MTLWVDTINNNVFLQALSFTITYNNLQINYRCYAKLWNIINRAFENEPNRRNWNILL